jgi:hypothetical protein
MTVRIALALSLAALVACDKLPFLKKKEEAKPEPASAATTSAPPAKSTAPAATSAASPLASAPASASASPTAAAAPFAGEYLWNDTIHSGVATVTQDGEKVTIKYGIGVANCKSKDNVKLTCSWADTGGNGSAYFTRNEKTGGFAGSWQQSDGSGSGGWTFTPKKK